MTMIEGTIVVAVALVLVSLLAGIKEGIDKIPRAMVAAADSQRIETDKMVTALLSNGIDKARAQVAGEFSARLTDLEQEVYNRKRHA